MKDHRRRPALLDRAAERRPRPEDVLLADELVEHSRADTAESSSKVADDASATIRAIVVFPTPGGPCRIIDGARPSSIARRRALPGPSTPV